MKNITIQDALQRAFKALLDGDSEQRDKMCDLAKTAFRGSNGIAANDKESVAGDTPIKIMEVIK